MKNILFRVDGGHAIGTGHLSRCLTLARAAKKHAIRSRFVVYGDADAAEIVRRAGFRLDLCQSTSIEYQVEDVEGFSIVDEVVVLDFIHSGSLAQIEAMPKLLGAWREKAWQLVLIDGSANQSLRAHMDIIDVDMILAPYAGDCCAENVPYLQLFGPRYFILSEGYQQLPKRISRAKANRVLVTCGGSDPCGITEKIMLGLNLIKFQLQIQVTLGSLFGSKLKTSILQIAKYSRHNVTMLDAPENLAEAMLWSDIAVATSGLTKYELASAGTPMASLSINADHEAVNSAFLKEGTSISLGVHDLVTPIDISKKVSDLLTEPELRLQMAELGQRLIDGLGADRVLASICSLEKRT